VGAGRRCRPAGNGPDDQAEVSEGFTRSVPSALTLSGALASFWLLSLAMRELQVGTAYAVRVGIGAVGTVVAAVMLFHGPVSLLRVAGILLIVTGIAVLKQVREYYF
jgi:quaternary ammonium compound-resistance protein SugE